MLQTVIVVIVVLVAAAWLIRRLAAWSQGEAACRNCAYRGSCQHDRGERREAGNGTYPGDCGQPPSPP